MFIIIAVTITNRCIFSFIIFWCWFSDFKIRKKMWTSWDHSTASDFRKVCECFKDWTLLQINLFIKFLWRHNQIEINDAIFINHSSFRKPLFCSFRVRIYLSVLFWLELKINHIILCLPYIQSLYQYWHYVHENIIIHVGCIDRNKWMKGMWCEWGEWESDEWAGCCRIKDDLNGMLLINWNENKIFQCTETIYHFTSRPIYISLFNPWELSRQDLFTTLLLNDLCNSYELLDNSSDGVFIRPQVSLVV